MAAEPVSFVAAMSASDGADWLNLWEVEELCRQARKHGLPDESEVRVEWQPDFFRTRYAVVSP